MPEEDRYIDASDLEKYNNEHINKIINDGYKIYYYFKVDKRLPEDKELHIQVYKDDEIAGGYCFIDNGHYLDIPLTNKTLEKHQCHGIAKAVYCFAECLYKKTIVPDEDHKSENAKAFWNMPNRPFGNPKKICCQH